MGEEQPRIQRAVGQEFARLPMASEAQPAEDEQPRIQRTVGQEFARLPEALQAQPAEEEQPRIQRTVGQEFARLPASQAQPTEEEQPRLRVSKSFACNDDVIWSGEPTAPPLTSMSRRASR